MPLTTADIEDIQTMLNEGKSNRAIADKYNVGKDTVARFVEKNNLVTPNRRNFGAATAQASARQRNAPAQYNQPNQFMPLMGNMAPLPPISDIPTLQYMLNLKDYEAQKARFELEELATKHKKLLESHTILEMNAMRHEADKNNAIKDAISEKGGMAEMGMKALEFVASSEPLSNALAGIINKYSSNSTPLLGTASDPVINEFIGTLNQQPDPKRKQVIAACYKLIQNEPLLNQIIPQTI